MKATTVRMAENNTADADDSEEEEFLTPFMTFQERLLSLDDVDVTDYAAVKRAIKTLDLIQSDIRDFTTELDMNVIFGMDGKDVQDLLNVYARQLKKLKGNEGVNFDAATASLENCVRLAMLFYSFMYAWYDRMCGCGIRLSQKVLGLIELSPPTLDLIKRAPCPSAKDNWSRSPLNRSGPGGSVTE